MLVGAHDAAAAQPHAGSLVKQKRFLPPLFALYGQVVGLPVNDNADEDLVIGVRVSPKAINALFAAASII